MRKCKVCGEIKPLSEYDLVSGRWRGYRCKECRRAHDRQQAKLPAVKQRHNERARRVRAEEKNRLRERRHAEVYRQRYPEKEAARRAVRSALQCNELSRPEQCENCAAPDRKPETGRHSIHAHHEDYSKPLAVKWLCVHCHAEEHRALKGDPK